ncbi:MAG: ATP-binding protein [Thermodesulfobacteriota bacterium]
MTKKTIGCDNCYRMGYMIEKKGDLSFARICDCVLRCRECNGSGSVLSKNEKAYIYISNCKVCGVRRRNVKLYNLAGVPAKYSTVLQVDTFRPKAKNESQQYALSYAKDFVKKYPNKKGFLFMGKAGLGKTHLAIGAISELTLEKGIRCVFKDFFHLLSELKEAYSQGTPENEVLLPLIETEVLVIDELGKGRSSEWELNILDQLISKRYNASKITLITTNYVSEDYKQKKGSGHSSQNEDQETLENRVGSRIASRLREMCEFIPIEGDDYRRTFQKSV